MTGPVPTPAPPYYAVIFTSVRTDADGDGYDSAARRMVALAAGREGFLGMDSARSHDGLGITVSYWTTEAAIQAWQRDAEHLEAQRMGREAWYSSFELRVCRVERARSFRAGS